MKLNLPKNNMFRAGALLATVALVIYIAHIVAQNIIHIQILHLQLIAFMLMSIAFGLLFLEITLKGS